MHKCAEHGYECAGGPVIHTRLRPVLDLLMAARPHQRDYLNMRAFVRPLAIGVPLMRHVGLGI